MADQDHIHVWGTLASSHFAGTVHRKCQVADCDIINALDDPEEWCADCGGQFAIDDNGWSFHLSATTPDQHDRKQDADHVAWYDSEDEDQ